ncbi:DUF2891 domain-containing protein [Chitinophaga barathri]|uniref:DUF2891 domain-containing protein n=1 Tax=Chitinophaga barathri TaxID=1647451 RepID=A0A3N4MF74_9BACT|nr:DUF2891 domain-containing protein [Chitinophaga barathri]RPD40317.1 DUF2891 domain-containing protein [Chitinophaga barathri]
MKGISLLLCLFYFVNGFAQMPLYEEKNGQLRLNTEGALHLSALPLKCMQHEYPYKTGIVYTDSSFLTSPKTYHPAFYGCYDWHSSVHGHWMLVRLLKMYPQLPNALMIRQKLAENLSQDNIRKELQLFRNKENKGFERIYGWSWLLQLQQELVTWNDPLAAQLRNNLAPMAFYFSNAYRDFLKKIAYPIRVGEHTNLAFGLRLAWDYAATLRDTALQSSIRNTAMRFYVNDKNCPASWEPGGYDFLSPCLEEADLMWRILPAEDYRKWVREFLPGLFEQGAPLFTVTTVNDRSDGKLVHLDGLNLSRAWCLYGIAKHCGSQSEAVRQLATLHLKAALPHVASGDYAGEHWLATFAVYALTVEF